VSDIRRRLRNVRSSIKGRAPDPESLQEVRDCLGKMPRRRDLLIEHLHRLQDRFGHLAARHLVALARELRLSPAEVYEVASFYHRFDLVRDGEVPPPPLTVRVCTSVTCSLFGAEELAAALEAGLGAGVRIKRVPCVGRCHGAPVAVVGERPVGGATPQTVASVVAAGDFAAPLPDYIDYDRYCRQGGYRTYRQCLSGELTPDAVLARLETSGLRGLGGAGFPVGRKWRIVREQPAPRRLAVNIDEGEPGTFKDGFYLCSDPHRFLEGTLIAAAVVEIEAVTLYLRDEYPAARAILEKELQALAADPPGPLPAIEVRRGAGAYICGEESAMVESIEGRRGMPRLRPPYLAERGLFGRPTLEHNLESLHWVRDLVELGPDGFEAHGRRGRKGLRSFSVSGRVVRPGVHRAPAGITLQELIDEFCGGMLPGHRLYGYLPGGASGGILPASLADLPLDYDTLAEYGCFIGTAAVIVFSHRDRARDLALNALRFFVDESCGQCTPCREGTLRARELMIQKVWDGALLEDLAVVMADASICGLGQAAPNLWRSVLRHFPGEVR
jgi:NADH:ubiquinone oxidoreductase subunit F (NADH-binding)/NADH:ubiquinone oxidoreductase subunit E